MPSRSVGVCTSLHIHRWGAKGDVTARALAAKHGETSHEDRVAQELSQSEQGRSKRAGRLILAELFGFDATREATRSRRKRWRQHTRLHL
jgi:hypothetical protein